MADFYDELASFLEDEGVGIYDTAAGRNIYTYKLPPDPDACIALLGLTGFPLGESRDVPSLHFPHFQVIVRNPDADLGAAKLEAVRTVLHGLLGEILPHWRILRCHADSEGGPIGSDEQGRFEFSINFTAEVNAETAS